MPRPSMYLFTAMLLMIMAVMDIVIVSVSADPSANVTSSLSRTKRQIPGLSKSSHRQNEDFVNDPSETCALAGISYFCYANSCARDCGISNRAVGDTRAPRNRWCYTTKGASGDQNFVGCTQDQDCSAIWNCATPCEAKPNKPDLSLCSAYGCDAGECWSSCNYKKLERAICYMRNAQEPGILKCSADQECIPKVNYRCYDKCKPF